MANHRRVPSWVPKPARIFLLAQLEGFPAEVPQSTESDNGICSETNAGGVVVLARHPDTGTLVNPSARNPLCMFEQGLDTLVVKTDTEPSRTQYAKFRDAFDRLLTHAWMQDAYDSLRKVKVDTGSGPRPLSNDEWHTILRIAPVVIDLTPLQPGELEAINKRRKRITEKLEAAKRLIEEYEKPENSFASLHLIQDRPGTVRIADQHASALTALDAMITSYGQEERLPGYLGEVIRSAQQDNPCVLGACLLGRLLVEHRICLDPKEPARLTITNRLADALGVIAAVVLDASEAPAMENVRDALRRVVNR